MEEVAAAGVFAAFSSLAASTAAASYAGASRVTNEIASAGHAGRQSPRPSQ